MIKKRNYGLDIARILSMLGIVIIHILGGGGVLASSSPSQPGYWISQLVNTAVFCSVNLFALLSGYLGFNKSKYSVYRTFELISVVLFYSGIITIIFLLSDSSLFNGIKDIIYGFCPPLAERYWYITCYIPVSLLQPFINKCINNLTLKEHKTLCILSVILFSVIPTFTFSDMFAFKDGFSFVWLLCCYIIGAYLKRSDFEKNFKINWLFIYGLLLAVLLVVRALFIFILHKDNSFLTYTSPFVLIMAVALLVFFKNMNIKHTNNIICVISGLTFDIYCLHCHFIIFDNYIRGSFKWIANAPFYTIPFIVLGVALLIFSICAIIGFIRMKIFRITKFSEILKNLSEKIDKVIFKF